MVSDEDEVAAPVTEALMNIPGFQWDEQDVTDCAQTLGCGDLPWWAFSGVIHRLPENAAEGSLTPRGGTGLGPVFESFWGHLPKEIRVGRRPCEPSRVGKHV